MTLAELALGTYPYPKEPIPFKMLVHIIEGESPVAKLHDGTFSPTFIDFVSKWCVYDLVLSCISMISKDQQQHAFCLRAFFYELLFATPHSSYSHTPSLVQDATQRAGYPELLEHAFLTTSTRGVLDWVKTVRPDLFLQQAASP